MRVCYVVGYYDPAIETGSAVVERVYTLRELAREQAKLDHIVSVVHLFHRDESLIRDGVVYHFVRPARGLGGLGRVAALISRDWSYPYYQLATRLVPAIRAFRPDVLHFFGLTVDLNLAIVGRFAGTARIPLVVQFHGGGPARNPARRAIQARNLRRASRLLFTTADHVRPWTASGLLGDGNKVVEFMETSSIFRWRSRDAARRETGMQGDPVFLWVGRLHPIKDPLTGLRAFEQIVDRWPGAQLYLYYLTDEMLPEIRAHVAERPILATHVHFRGRATYEEMEAIYNSADFLLQASTGEYSGCAVLEAMSCGVVPVVTDIPSFRTMTDGGRYGILFPPGDAASLAQRVLSTSISDLPARSAAVRDHFVRALSFPVLARQLDALYREVTGHVA